MKSMHVVKQITDYEEWNKFVDISPQGTIFCKAEWLKLYNQPWKIYGYYKNGNLTGGIANFDNPQPLTPFQGILTIPTPDMKYANIISLHNEVANALLDFVPDKFCNHYEYPDIRPFLWAGWEAFIRYTYVVDLRNLTQLWSELEKDTRYDITRSQKLPVVFNRGYEEGFYNLYIKTFERKGMDAPVNKELIEKVQKMGGGYSAFDGNTKELLASAVCIFDAKRAYYILAASSVSSVPSLLLWEIFKDLASMGYKEVDLVGANNREIALFKRGFGGALKNYYRISKI